MGIMPLKSLKMASYMKNNVEGMEQLEQLRFLEAGHVIHTIETDQRPIGVDTASDLERVRRIITEDSL